MSKYKCQVLEIKSFYKTLGGLGLFAFMIILGFVAFSLFSPIVASNAETENTAKVSTPAGTISLATEDNVTINITPTPTQKIYSKTTALKITNSCKKGATITLSTNKSHNNLERQGADSLIKTIASVSGGGTLTDNSWGYTLDNITYSKVPTKDQSPATIYNTNTATVSTTTPENLNLTYAVKTDDTIPSGTYTNDLVYTVNVKPECLQYTLKFNLDNGTGKSGAIYTDRQLSYGTKINLSDFTPTRTNYEFMGWIATTNNPAVSSTIYNPTANLDVNPANETEVTLKAKWKYIKGLYSISNMQQMNPNICKANTTPNRNATQLDTDGSRHGDPNYVPTVTLTDTRDNNTYTVSKLADGKCWMTQNLRIAGKTITPADSNVTANYTIPASSINGFSSYDTSNAYVDSDGGFYTWHAATAGTGTTAIAVQGQNATASICPKGWRLPTGGNNGEFKILSANYPSYGSMINSDPANFTLAGGVYNSMRGQQGLIGYYWSSTTVSNNGAYYMGLQNSGDVNPVHADGKYSGFSVRCIADDKLTFDNIANMQDMTPEICANAKEHQTATLRDIRDGNTYTVAKLKDGKCWMTQNLRIINKTLTSTDSDVTTNYTIPASSINGFSSNNTSNAYVDSDGGLYTWYTATAGAGTQSMSTQGQNATVSICSKGWRLPTSGNGGEFEALNNRYSSISDLTANADFTFSGRVHSSSRGYQGSSGYYWSSTVNSSSNAYHLLLNTSYVYPANFSSKNYGFSVRCIAR